MVQRRKITAQELEKWLLSQGAIPVTEEMKKEPWYEKASKLPPCLEKEMKLPTARNKGNSKLRDKI